MASMYKGLYRHLVYWISKVLYLFKVFYYLYENTSHLCYMETCWMYSCFHLLFTCTWAAITHRDTEISLMLLFQVSFMDVWLRRRSSIWRRWRETHQTLVRHASLRSDFPDSNKRSNQRVVHCKTQSGARGNRKDVAVQGAVCVLLCLGGLALDCAPYKVALRVFTKLEAVISHLLHYYTLAASYVQVKNFYF